MKASATRTLLAAGFLLESGTMSASIAAYDVLCGVRDSATVECDEALTLLREVTDLVIRQHPEVDANFQANIMQFGRDVIVDCFEKTRQKFDENTDLMITLRRLSFLKPSKALDAGENLVGELLDLLKFSGKEKGEHSFFFEN